MELSFQLVAVQKEVSPVVGLLPEQAFSTAYPLYGMKHLLIILRLKPLQF